MREKYNKRRLSKKMIKIEYGNKNIMFIIDIDEERQVIDNKVLERVHIKMASKIMARETTEK